MSGGPACRCPLPRGRKLQDWEVIRYREAASAFGGGRSVASNYSDVRCRRCGAIWRTCAQYVDVLDLAPEYRTTMAKGRRSGKATG